MAQGPGQQRLTPEQRRRLEELEDQREADRAADMARQRAAMGQDDQDTYVARRVEREMHAIAEAERLALEEEARESGAATQANPYLLLAIGLALSGLILAVIKLISH